MSTTGDGELRWYRVLELDELPEGRVTTVTAGHRDLAMTHFEGQYGMNITHVLLNNSELGKISKEQRAGEWDVWQTSLRNPDFSKYAELCGAFGVRVTDRSELDDALAPGPRSRRPGARRGDRRRAAHLSGSRQRFRGNDLRTEGTR